MSYIFLYLINITIIQVTREYNTLNIPRDLLLLARYPRQVVRRFKTFLINGFRFRTKASEANCKTRNSGVVVKATTSSYASTSDIRSKDGTVTYYGEIIDIIELDYTAGAKVVLFKCEWADKTKKDEHNFTLVDFKTLKSSEKLNPFVLPSQVLQAFYVRDPRDGDFRVPVVIMPRDNFQMNCGGSDDVDNLSTNIPFPCQDLANDVDFMEE